MLLEFVVPTSGTLHCKREIPFKKLHFSTKWSSLRLNLLRTIRPLTVDVEKKTSRSHELFSTKMMDKFHEPLYMSTISQGDSWNFVENDPKAEVDFVTHDYLVYSPNRVLCYYTFLRKDRKCHILHRTRIAKLLLGRSPGYFILVA